MSVVVWLKSLHQDNLDYQPLHPAPALKLEIMQCLPRCPRQDNRTAYLGQSTNRVSDQTAQSLSWLFSFCLQLFIHVFMFNFCIVANILSAMYLEHYLMGKYY